MHSKKVSALASSPEIRFWTGLGAAANFAKQMESATLKFVYELDLQFHQRPPSNRVAIWIDKTIPLSTVTMAQPALNKISYNSPSRQHPSELEINIATALYELETNIPDLKSALRPLQFVSAREVCLRSPLWRALSK